jgi:hypothetical protein
MPAEKRVWTLWQPPVLLTRNLFSVPGAIRVSGYGTLLFELSGLANQRFGTHITFSTYSMTMALVSHRQVDGWDTDVIAEDHHMFCKCYFASLWEEVSSMREKAVDVALKPRVELQPVWLPTVSYLAESSEGYLASMHARFVQAQRHSYGVVELGYVLLQYILLIKAVGAFKLPLRTHTQIISLGWKMFTVHITNTIQAFSLLVSFIVMIPTAVSWILSGGLHALVSQGLSAVAFGSDGSGSVSLTNRALCAAFGPMAPVSLIASSVLFTVVLDVLEGRYALPPPPIGDEGENEDTIAKCDAPVEQSLSVWQKLMLACKMQNDCVFLTEPTVFVYGMIPELMAAWSLLRRNNFVYIVGEKPVGLKED